MMSRSPKKIAKTIRHSSGGLRFVKGLGLLVEGRAQVSMNLTDYHKTPIALVVETVRRLVGFGTRIADTPWDMITGSTAYIIVRPPGLWKDAAPGRRDYTFVGRS
jgi:hypothetical protein